jgi:hypothetical protein
MILRETIVLLDTVLAALDFTTVTVTILFELAAVAAEGSGEGVGVGPCEGSRMTNSVEVVVASAIVTVETTLLTCSGALRVIVV